MRILVDSRSLIEKYPGGVTNITRAWLQALIQASPEDTFILATTGSRKPLLPSFGANVQHLHISLPNKLWSLLCFLRLTSFDQWLQKETPDLLLLPNAGHVGRPKLPFMLVVHDLSFLIEPRWFSWRTRLWHTIVGARWLIKHATHLFAVSSWTKRDLVERLTLSETQISTLPFGKTLQKTPSPLPAMLEKKRFVLILGAGDLRKNAACAIQAIELLRQDPAYADLWTVLVGFPDSRLPLSKENIIILHRPTDEDLAALFKHAAVFLYPSWYEGFGLPLHEAAHFGIPCIASTASALPETAPKSTLFAPPAKPHLWQAALKIILNNPEMHRTSTTLGDWRKAAEKIKERMHRNPSNSPYQGRI